MSAETLFDEKHVEDITWLLDNEFSPLLSTKRLELIKKCLLLRYQQIKQIFLNY